MNIDVYTTVSNESFEFAENLISNYNSLSSKRNEISFIANCVATYDDRLVKKLSNLGFVVKNFFGARGTSGHAMSINSAFKMFENQSVNIIADADTMMVAKSWDQILVDYFQINSDIGVVGTSYEDIGRSTSGIGNCQTYKNLPNVTWMACNSLLYDFTSYSCNPNKNTHLAISDSTLSKTYNLPIGYTLLRDTGWEFPEFLMTNSIQSLAFKHFKQNDHETKVIKNSGYDYHEEYHFQDNPFVIHHRGSMKHKFKQSHMSNVFFTLAETYIQHIL